jgi:large subunit ribosomal protein L18
LVDDVAGRTVALVTTNTKVVKAGGKKTFANIENAKALGKAVAEKAIAAGVTQVVFDRGGYPYHGAVKALAEAAREAGLKF